MGDETNLDFVKWTRQFVAKAPFGSNWSDIEIWQAILTLDTREGEGEWSHDTLYIELLEQRILILTLQRDKLLREVNNEV